MIRLRARIKPSARLEQGRSRKVGSNSGFSLMELILVLGIVGMLSTAAVPSFKVAVEETRVDRSVGELRSMWIAQRLHFLQAGRFADSLAELSKANLLPMGATGRTEGFAFKIQPDRRGELKMKARRVKDSSWSGEIYLDKNARLKGEISSKQGDVVTP
jgi:prepilin-type N-terminal cleavage/methylation domain-containing protein